MGYYECDDCGYESGDKSEFDAPIPGEGECPRCGSNSINGF